MEARCRRRHKCDINLATGRQTLRAEYWMFRERWRGFLVVGKQEGAQPHDVIADHR